MTRSLTQGDVVLTDVHKRYPAGDMTITAVDGVSLKAAAGSVVAVMGASGSGKSTLLHLIGGIDRADSGSIHVGDVEVTALNRSALVRYRRTVGFVFQRFHLLPALSALDNVIAPMLGRQRKSQLKERAMAALDEVGLLDRAGCVPSQLSGGQQQRVAIARAIVTQPRLILADEPTGNLDSATGRGVMQLLMEIRQRHGTTVMIVTHDDSVAGSCDTVFHIRDGRCVDEAST